MRSISIFVLLIYWSIIILAPVLSKEEVNLTVKQSVIAFKSKLNK